MAYVVEYTIRFKVAYEFTHSRYLITMMIALIHKYLQTAINDVW